MNLSSVAGSILAGVLLILAGCGGGTEPAPLLASPAPSTEPFPPPTAQPPTIQPLFPAIDGEVIGMPGQVVPGLKANYVWTGLGWLSESDDVIFEAVIQWDPSMELGCGILRRAADGKVNPVLMQGQFLPGTGGGHVRHPGLPIESRGGMLLLPALVEGGTIRQGLFAAPKWGGAPVLLHGETTGEVRAAEFARDGSVIAEVVRDDVVSILLIENGAPARTLCTGCSPGFSTDGERILVRRAQGVYAIALDGVDGVDGVEAPILTLGETLAGVAGSVRAVRGAWISADGDPVVHILTDDAAHPELLVRFDPAPRVLAACGMPAPGTLGTFETLFPSRQRGEDVLFAATIAGDPAGGTALFFAPAARAAPALAQSTLVFQDGAQSDEGGYLLGLLARDSVAGEGGRAAFGAVLFDVEGNGPVGTGVFLPDGAGGARRLLTTSARVSTIEPAILVGFDYDLRDAVRVAPDGRTLVHALIRPDRLPDSSLGALILLR